MPRAWSAEKISASVSWRARFSRKTEMMEFDRVAIAVSMRLKSKVENLQMLLLLGTKRKRFLDARRRNKNTHRTHEQRVHAVTLDVVENGKKHFNSRQCLGQWKILSHRQDGARSLQRVAQFKLHVSPSIFYFGSDQMSSGRTVLISQGFAI